MTNEILMIAFYLSAGCLALLACGVLWVVVTAIIRHMLPNCAYSRWINAEVYVSDPVQSIKVGDCITNKMPKPEPIPIWANALIRNIITGEERPAFVDSIGVWHLGDEKQYNYRLESWRIVFYT
jgi:hypothetical protein